jgi:hypothetical protein
VAFAWSGFHAIFVVVYSLHFRSIFELITGLETMLCGVRYFELESGEPIFTLAENMSNLEYFPPSKRTQLMPFRFQFL